MVDGNDDVTIAEFSTDIADQEEPPPLPKGEYPAVIREAKVATSQRQTKYANIAFFIDPAHYPPDYEMGNPDGTILMYRRLSLEDQPMARYRLRKFFEALGLPVPGRTVDLTTLASVGCKVKIGHQKFEGSDRAEIQGVSGQ